MDYTLEQHLKDIKTYFGASWSFKNTHKKLYFVLVRIFVNGNNSKVSEKFEETSLLKIEKGLA